MVGGVRQGKARQGKPRQGKARQGKAKQGEHRRTAARDDLESPHRHLDNEKSIYQAANPTQYSSSSTVSAVHGSCSPQTTVCIIPWFVTPLLSSTYVGRHGFSPRQTHRSSSTLGYDGNRYGATTRKINSARNATILTPYCTVSQEKRGEGYQSIGPTFGWEVTLLYPETKSQQRTIRYWHSTILAWICR